MLSLLNVEQKRALRTYHFQLGVTKTVNLKGDSANKAVKNPTESRKNVVATCQNSDNVRARVGSV
jgi:hypothetical protein